jgi:hypothetical protein
MPRAAHAVPVLNTTEGLPAIDMAQRDSSGQVRSFAAEDDNSDGVISLIADLDPLSDGWVEVHIDSGGARSTFVFYSIAGTAAHSPSPFTVPFLVTGNDDRLITNWLSSPSARPPLGQDISVAGGHVAGFDALVYLSPGLRSALEAVHVDLSTLPLCTGPARVGGFLTVQVVPEPSGAMLIAITMYGLATVKFIRRSRTEVSVQSPRHQTS